MLPVSINVNNYKKENQEQEKQIKEMETKQNACSQQAMANQLVLGTMPTNPNAAQIQQMPIND